MGKIMEIIAKETGGKSYNTMKYSFDSLNVPKFDYDDEGNKIMKWQFKAETESHKKSIDLTEKAKSIQTEKPLITYFLDGSRHAYKVDDISYEKQVYPVIAGQIGVGCCYRENKLMHPKMLYRRKVIVLPDVCNRDGWHDDEFFAAQTEKLNQYPELKRLKISFDAILCYKVSNKSEKRRIEDKGIARVQDYMIEAEKEMVSELVRKKCLNQDNFLLKDGSLEYKPMKTGKENFRILQRIRNNYRWVIGVSKSFNPESILDHTGKPNANYIADLPLFHRTPVALYENSEFLGDVKFGVWYLRIRDKKQTRTPFDGVIKIERVLVGDENEYGIDSEEVDLISANLINERTPTCYGSDKRWANHLYPVYLTESYVKSTYMSTEMFLHLF